MMIKHLISFSGILLHLYNTLIFGNVKTRQEAEQSEHGDHKSCLDSCSESEVCIDRARLESAADDARCAWCGLATGSEILRQLRTWWPS